MKKWFAGGASKITLGRIPCMSVAAYAILWQGQNDIGFYWIGCLALVIGMWLDWLDGFWARNIAGGATAEGQYLDQFIDKWGFVYPLLVIFCYHAPPPWYIYPGLAVMLALDVRSNVGHYRNYQHSLLHGFNKSFGAVWPGKVKFGLQNGIICVWAGLRCPLHTYAGTDEDVLIPSAFVLWAAKWLQYVVPFALLAAILLASASLFKRKKITAQAKAEVAAPAALSLRTA